MKYLLCLLMLASCADFRALNVEELNAKKLIGHWEMSIEPYYLDIYCSGSMAFLRPTTGLLYADQKGSGYVISDLKDDAIITGPFFRSSFNVEEWPVENDGKLSMIIDGRKWYKTKTFDCK